MTMTSSPDSLRQPSPEAVIVAQKRMIDEFNDNRIVLIATIDEMQGEFTQVVQAYEGALAALLSMASNEDRPKMQAHLDTLNGKTPQEPVQD